MAPYENNGTKKILWGILIGIFLGVSGWACSSIINLKASDAAKQENLNNVQRWMDKVDKKMDLFSDKLDRFLEK